MLLCYILLQYIILYYTILYSYITVQLIMLIYAVLLLYCTILYMTLQCLAMTLNRLHKIYFNVYIITLGQIKLQCTNVLLLTKRTFTTNQN